MMDVREKCNCGKPARYMHMKVDGEVMSCNKHTVCPTYDELVKTNQELTSELYMTSALIDKIRFVLVELGVHNVAD